MAFDPGVIVAVLVSLLCCGLTVWFFKYYGAFRHPWMALLLMLVSAMIPFVMVVGILPYDISLCLFGKATAEGNKPLKISLDVLYWVSFVLTWVVNPIVVSFLRYKESISLKHRIWLTIRENLIVYGIIVSVIVVGVIILIATGELTWSNLFPLAISLANGYGLLVLCLCLGHGFVSMPRWWWQMATPENRYLFFLNRITRETRLCAAAIADGDAASTYATIAEEKLRGEQRNRYERLGKPRAIRINQLKGEIPLPEQFYRGTSAHKKIQKLRKVEWEHCSTGRLEDFFAVMDETIERMEEATNILQYSSEGALAALKQYQEVTTSTLMMVLRRAFAILLALLNVICLWGEIALMFKREYSLFYIISHVKMPQIVDIICVSTPILAYLLYVGSWSLTHLRLGSFFRFTIGATNANTLNYFAIIICRLGPTIGFHYLQQIDASNSEFQKVMGVMDVVVFIGSKWNIYAPILLIVMIFFFAFRVPDRILACCGKGSSNFDNTTLDYGELKIGEEVLMELQPEARSLIENSRTGYSAIVANSTGWSKKDTMRDHLIGKEDVAA